MPPKRPFLYTRLLIPALRLLTYFLAILDLKWNGAEIAEVLHEGNTTDF